MKKRPIQKKPPGFNILLLACGSKCVWRCNLQHDATHLSHPSSPPTPHALCYLFSFWHQPYYLSIRCTVIAELLCTHNGANVVTRFANQHRETLGFISWITSRWDYSENEMILNRIFFLCALYGIIFFQSVNPAELWLHAQICQSKAVMAWLSNTPYTFSTSLFPSLWRVHVAVVR